MMDTTRRTSRRRVSFWNNHQDLMCWVLFSAGMYDQAISELTGLTKSQVMYRTRLAQHKDRAKFKKGDFINARKSFRLGDSRMAKYVVKMLSKKYGVGQRLAISVLDRNDVYKPFSTGVLRPRKL